MITSRWHRTLASTGLLVLCGALALGCASANKTSTPGGPGGDGDKTGDGDTGDGDGDHPIPGDGDTGDGDSTHHDVPTFTYKDPGATGAYKDGSLPADIKDQFGGSGGDKPSLVYPIADSMHAPNLGHIQLQWHQGSSDYSVFRIDISKGDTKYRYYVPCAKAECIVSMPKPEWLVMADKFAGDQVDVVIAGSDGKGGAVGTSDATSIHFAPEGVFGALYYWAAQADAIKRADLNSDKATPFITPKSKTNQFACQGCHAVSKDGSTIAFAVSPIFTDGTEGSELSAIQVAPTSDPTMPYVKPTNGTTPITFSDPQDGDPPAGASGPENFLGHNVALNKDGTVAAVNGIPANGGWPPYFELRNARTGATLHNYPEGDAAFGTSTDGSLLLPIFPEWSPDGKSLVVALAADNEAEGCVYTAETCRSSIAIIPVNGNAIGTPKILVNSSTDEFHFYPTWSPDGKWIAFASGIKRMSGGTYETSESNDNALIRLVRATGGPYDCPSKDCVELDRGRQYKFSDAMSKKGLHSTWPKFTPFAQGDNDSIFFISFNSHIPYGFIEPAKDDEGKLLSQIWMFAVDVSKFGSSDPSYAPFWLPQQEPADGSLAPYWSEGLPCSQDGKGGCAGCVGEESCQTSPATGECSCVVTVM